MCSSCRLSTLSSCSWDLVAVGRSMGGIYPGQSAARTGCDHWPPTSTICGGSAVQGQGGGAPKWSVAVHWVYRLWGFLSGAGQGQPQLCFALGHPTCAIKQSEMGAICAGHGDSQVKPSYKSRLPAWGSLKPAVACLRGFRKLCSMSQD